MLACVHHLDPVSFAHAGPALDAAGVRVAHVHLRRDPLPAVDEVHGIISFGAAESVLDLGRDEQLAAEARWLGAALERGIPVLGVCFGAQLLAHVLGGEVFRLPRRYLTWAPLRPTAEAAGDPVVSGAPREARALLWNEDGFEPPAGAQELFERAGPGCLAFRHGESAWGVQFHPEVDAPVLDHWYATWPHALSAAGVGEAAARRADAAFLERQTQLSAAIFAGFAGVVRSAPRPSRASRSRA